MKKVLALAAIVLAPASLAVALAPPAAAGGTCVAIRDVPPRGNSITVCVPI